MPGQFHFDFSNTSGRIRFWAVLVVIVMVIFGFQLFYVQVIRYSHYHQAALSYQLKQYEIPATRGLIYAKDGNSNVPIVLNQKLYTLFADPPLITKPQTVAYQISKIIGGTPTSYIPLLTAKYTQYVVIARKLSQSQNQKIVALQDPGLGTTGQDYRVYPDGSLAAQVLGFVNSKGVGEYGIEQALNPLLAGKSGMLKAITAANGVPLAASKQNTQIAPVSGSSIVLTLNVGIQAQLEKILAQDYKSTKSQGLSAIVMDPYNAQVVAMANYPTYNPANYQNVTNQQIFQNAAIDYPIEPGSVMKTLTTSTALNVGAITPNESFYDPAHWLINGFNIHDISIDGGPREQNIQSILSLSLNTGATWMLMQMGQRGGTQILPKGIETWHNYMVNHFRLGQPTGIQQGYEASGYVPPANLNDPSIDLRYANTAFGQGVSLTALQLITALSSVINGGTYYQPSLVNQIISPNGHVTNLKPKVLERNVVSPNVGPELEPLMEGVVKSYFHGGFSFMNFPPNYIVGGKTGTAQVAKPTGGYYKNVYNGTYIGFVGGNAPQYLIVVYNIKPGVPGYAGSFGGQPVFADIAHMLINEGFVTPKTH
jgi:cell division protein FtsI/penicillin-binding protein 2